MKGLRGLTIREIRPPSQNAAKRPHGKPGAPRASVANNAFNLKMYLIGIEHCGTTQVEDGKLVRRPKSKH